MKIGDDVRVTKEAMVQAAARGRIGIVAGFVYTTAMVGEYEIQMPEVIVQHKGRWSVYRQVDLELVEVENEGRG